MGTIQTLRDLKIAEGFVYIPQIDGLRAFAVLAVMIHQLSSWFMPGGFCGVDVFFVISGYVISATLAGDAQKPLIQYLSSFYVRRILRIVPALLVCLVLTGIVATMFIPESWLSSSNHDTALSAFWAMSNFTLNGLRDGYFSPMQEFNPFVHTWSLGVEEQFYLVFPLLFFINLKLKKRTKVSRLWGDLAFSGIIISSLVCSFKLTASNFQSAYYLIPGRFWELAFGAVLFELQDRKRLSVKSAFCCNVALILGLMMVFSGFFLLHPSSFPFPGALLPVSGTILSIIGVSSPQYRDFYLVRLLGNRVLIFIGKISYSLYLWHWPVFVLLRWTVGLESPLFKIIALILTFILSVLSFYFIENPIRKSSFLLKKPKWIIIAGGLGCVLICWAFTRAVFQHYDWISRSVTKDVGIWYPYPYSEKSGLCKGEVEKSKIDSVKIESYKRSACDQAALTKHRIFVIGDSHAMAYSRMLFKLTEEQGVPVSIFTRDHCSFVNLQESSGVLGENCEQFVRTTMTEIKKQAQPGDIVFLASLRMNRLGDQWAVFREKDVIARQQSDRSRQERSDALREADGLINELSQDHLFILIDAPLPIFRSPPFRCSDWFNHTNPRCAGGMSIDRDFLLNFRQPVMGSLSVLSSKYPRLEVWDAYPVLCPGETCSAFDQGGPLFFDGDHLSGHGNVVLYSSFLSQLKRIWNR